MASLRSTVEQAKEAGTNLEIGRFDPSADWRSKDMFVISDTSAFGCLNVVWAPSRGSHLALSWFGPDCKVVEKERVDFRNLIELEIPIQFLLSCGPLPDLANAQRLLPRVLEYLDKVRPQSSCDSACLIISQPIGHNALEWAAKKGCVLCRPNHLPPTLGFSLSPSLLRLPPAAATSPL